MGKKKKKNSYNDEAFLEDRVVFMEQEFNEESINKLKRQILALISDNPTEDITIYISSFGGGVYDFLSVYDIISTAKCKFTTVALGKCMSAGAYLLLCGDERIAYPNTRIMLHELAHSISYRKLHDSKNSLEEGERVQQILTDIVAEKTKIENPSEFLKEDQFFSSEEAIELGVIDRIVD